MLAICAIVLFYPVTSYYQEFGLLVITLVYLAAVMCWDKDRELRKTDKDKASKGASEKQ